MNDKADFTQGSIFKKLIAFMMPVLGALILQAAYGAVDLAYVMSIQPDASLTKIGLAAPVSTMVGIVLNVGFYIYLGKQEKKISKK